MKPIQLLIDEPLLRRLDADPEVKRVGRSAVLRRAASEYLRRSRSKRITESYRRAYGGNTGLGHEWTGWENEGSWPER
ncbi:MAG TPA: ribbon-helix-helix protein, CopG family [Vicinamibacteria bacterium]|nr:ribbon-helix-helix protein, CopG family [Vicinamibacteria bacterium]